MSIILIFRFQTGFILFYHQLEVKFYNGIAFKILFFSNKLLFSIISHNNTICLLVSAGGRRVRHGAELRDPGCAEHPAYARTPGPLPLQFAGMN